MKDHQNPSKIIYHLATIPSSSKFTKFISYFTGIQALTLDHPNHEIDVEIDEEVLSPSHIRFIITVG